MLITLSIIIIQNFYINKISHLKAKKIFLMATLKTNFDPH
jgi:hypothetical protein